MASKEEVEAKIIERAAQVFGKDAKELSSATRWTEDLQAKSGNLTQITTFLEDEFDVEVPFMQFRRKPTIGEAAEYVSELTEE
jgi:acyl carrier protein